MRQVIVVLALLTVPGLTWAQQALPPFSALGPIGFPLPPIGFPLPPIGLPPATVALPSPAIAIDSQTRHDESWRFGRADRFRRDTGHRVAPGHTIVYFATPYYWPSDGAAKDTSAAAAAMPAPEKTVATGVLRLKIEPLDSLQLFVDDEYVGTSEDLAGELTLDAGIRRVEIRKPDYEPLTFAARIVGGRAITYRGTLTPVVAPPPVGRPDDVRSRRPQTFYLIPGCYLGNVPPEQVRMAPGCEGRQVITYTP